MQIKVDTVRYATCQSKACQSQTFQPPIAQNHQTQHQSAHGLWIPLHHDRNHKTSKKIQTLFDVMRMSSICKRIFITRNGRAVCICICIRIFSATTTTITNFRHCRSSLNSYLTLPYPFTRRRRIWSIKRTSSFRLPLLMREENLSRVCVFPPSALFSKKSKPVLRLCDPGRRAKQSNYGKESHLLAHMYL